MKKTTEKKIIEIIKTIKPYEDICESTRLIESGILDSLSILVLINELEECFSITIDAEKMTPENFASLQDIKLFIQQLTTGELPNDCNE